MKTQLSCRHSTVGAYCNTPLPNTTNNRQRQGNHKGLPLRIPELETLIKGMLNKKILLDLIRHFIVFEKLKLVGADLRVCPKDTGIIM